MSNRPTRIKNGVKQVQMICKHENHTWWRDSQRGKPPHWCPDHKPAVESIVRSLDNSRPARVEAAMKTAGLDIAEKAAKDLKQAGDPEVHVKTTKELEAEREAEKARERAKAVARLANIDNLIVEADAKAETACEANLKALDAVNERKPETLKAQERTYGTAISACNHARRLREDKRKLEQVAA